MFLSAINISTAVYEALVVLLLVKVADDFFFFFFFFFKEFIYTVPHLYIDYLVAGITSRHYSILTVHHFGTKYTYKYMQTTVITTNGITTYLYIQNHTARNMSIAHKFVNVILIHSCKTVS